MLRTLGFLVLVLLFAAAPCLPQGAEAPAPEETPKSPLRVDGVVRGPAGPVRGVMISVEVRDMRLRRESGRLRTQTDEQGNFQFDLSAWDFPRYGLKFDTRSPRYVDHMVIEEVDKGDLPKHFEFELHPGSIARGTVTDSEGNPLEGVEISAPEIHDQISNSKGEWEVTGMPPGKALLEFRLEGYSREYFPVQTDGPELVENLQVTLKSARSLAVLVRAPSGKPLPGARATVFMDKRTRSQVTGRDGVTTFVGVPEDLRGIDVSAEAMGFLPTHRQLGSEVTSNTVELTVESGAFLAGKITLPTGEAVAGARILEGDQNSYRAPEAISDDQGNWRLGPFPVLSKVIISAMPPSREPVRAIGDLSLRQNGETLEGEVELWPGGFSSRFEGNLQGAHLTLRRHDKGVGGFGTTVTYEASGVAPDAREIRGSVEVSGMKQNGKFRLRRQGSGNGMAGEWELLDEIEPSQLNLAPAQLSRSLPILAVEAPQSLVLSTGGTIHGRIRSEHAEEFVDGEVAVLLWNGTRVYSERAPIQPDGSFDLQGVPPGSVLLQAFSKDRQRGTVPLCARAGIDVVLETGQESADPLDP